MTKKQHRKSSSLPKVLIIGGIILLAFVIVIIKNKPQAASTSTSTNGLPEAQLQSAMQAGQPTLAFYHSTDCQQCIVMMGIVEQVYPEYVDSVTLVDINVYDRRNIPLLQKVGLQFIPTLIFYDRNGNEQVYVGVMEADQLRQTLAVLAGDE